MTPSGSRRMYPDTRSHRFVDDRVKLFLKVAFVGFAASLITNLLVLFFSRGSAAPSPLPPISAFCYPARTGLASPRSRAVGTMRQQPGRPSVGKLTFYVAPTARFALR